MSTTFRVDRPAPHLWLMALAAAFALLQPALAAFAPDLAGWNPTHSHIYTSAASLLGGGHHHPFDATDAHPAPFRGWDLIAHDGGAVSGDEASEEEGVLFAFSASATGTAIASLAVAVIQQPPLFEQRVSRASPSLEGLVLTPRPRPPRG